MNPYDEIKAYSKTVCEQIRWKKAHKVIAEEIENHICDQRDAYILQGDDEITATKKAILQMGDAVSVGMELDRIHRPKPQWIMISLTALLMLIGALANYFIDKSEYTLFCFAPYIIALTVFLICYFLDFTVLGRYAGYIYLLVLAFSAFQILLGKSVGGRMYYSTGRFTVSLSYLTLIFPLAYALLFYSLRHMNYKGIVLCEIGFVLFAVVLLLIPSFFGFIIFSITAFANFYICALKGWFGFDKKQGLLLALIIPISAVILALVYIIINPGFLTGITFAFNPYNESDGYGYLSCLIRDLLVNSKFVGKGSVPYRFESNIPEIPFAKTDYILTAITYNFGWIAFIVIIAVILAFSVLGIYYVTRQRSVLGTLLSLSIILTLILQASLYIINNLGFGIIPEVSMPLISYGKTALVINSSMIGFMLSVFRTGDIIKDSSISLLKPQSRIFMKMEN
ncbi:cell division protein FtsW (lipid II flippase) [Herbinix hemicellulosilytica]|uniref:Putative membrane protein n=1 Tax=Herbinix hemicellulosilytica TaxID=1564487 RepID=A0A0H5SIV2_HERHM|nr:FtsW/RodA/SpoVE family cell cycle protein [Herbinix hemicellulosilytica]RBP56419.1 cell division protein FtsW (lipid II flippase) [Herbinix hemicellulosilytica]CRZ35442.1 putative membrane protein [Herbinix hemicellulosilytica]